MRQWHSDDHAGLGISHHRNTRLAIRDRSGSDLTDQQRLVPPRGFRAVAGRRSPIGCTRTAYPAEKTLPGTSNKALCQPSLERVWRPPRRRGRVPASACGTRPNTVPASSRCRAQPHERSQIHGQTPQQAVRAGWRHSAQSGHHADARAAGHSPSSRECDAKSSWRPVETSSYNNVGKCGETGDLWIRTVARFKGAK